MDPPDRNADRGGGDVSAWWETFFRGPWERVQLPGYPEERTRAEATFMVDALGLARGARILDVPCGEGRHTIELARRGFEATGVDFNDRAISAARQRAAEAAVTARFIVADMRELESVEEYDAAVCFFGSFGYFGDEENLDFLRRVARALQPQGRFLLEGHVAETLYPKFRERDWSWVREEPPLRVLEERRMNLDEGRVESTWTFVAPDAVESRSLSIRIYAYRELRDLLKQAGFSAVQALETGTREPFSLGASRLTMIGTKP
jgi:SAM-dependent methyltransferase